MRFFIFSVFLTVHFISGAESGIEILKNGTFKNDSFWNDDQNGDASCKYLFENNIMSVAITSPGSEWWYIQLTQKNICIKKDKAYILSFDIKSTKPRSILTSVCKDGGDYLPYSIRDTLKVDTVFKSYSQDFPMIQPTDSSARIEFDFGVQNGDIQLKNVSLLEYPGPKLTFTDISPSTVAFSDEPVKVKWFSVGLKDTINLSISYDNGFSWSLIRSNLKAVDSLEWTPGTTYSPWCFFKLSTSKISAISSSPLQIIPKMELINNGSFRNSFTSWKLIADTSLVTSTMSVQNGSLSISNTAPKDKKAKVTLSQSSLKLNKGDVYEINFTCNTKTSCTLKVDLTDCKPFSSDSSEPVVKDIAINSTPTRYHKQFKASTTMTNGDLMFTIDAEVDTITFSNISLVKIPVSDEESAKFIAYRSNKSKQEQSRVLFLTGISQSHLTHRYTSNYFSLSGRKISGRRFDESYNKIRGSGVVIVVPRNNDLNKQSDIK
jgi:hypothetical protein